MKTLYILLILFLSNLSFGQTVEIVSADDYQNYSGQTVTLSGYQLEIYKTFYVKNLGNNADFYWGREVISQSNPDFLIQLCDENICYNTSGKLWVGPMKTIDSGDSLLIKPQLYTGGVSGTAEVVYYVLDENKDKIDSVIVQFTSTASVQFQKEITFNIYPNPAAQNSVTIQGDNLIGGTIIFTDALGKKAKTVSFGGSEATIDIENLKRGVYFIHIYNSSGEKSVTQRFIKQ